MNRILCLEFSKKSFPYIIIEKIDCWMNLIDAEQTFLLIEKQRERFLFLV
jgi:hypothetical protein